STPQCTCQRQHANPVRAIRQPAHRNGNQTIEQREIQPADTSQLPVRDLQVVLDRLRQDRQQLTIQEVQDIDETQHAEHKPCSRVRTYRGCSRQRVLL